MGSCCLSSAAVLRWLSGAPLLVIVENDDVERSQPVNHYFISKHIYPCHLLHGAILLDLRRDQYVGLNEKQSIALSRVVRGWSRPNVAQLGGIAVPEEDVDSLVGHLLKVGVLTTNLETGKTAASCVNPTPIGRELPETPATIHPIAPYFGRFLIAVTRAYIAFRCRSLLYAVESCRKRKQALARFGDTPLDRTLQVTRVFWSLRPFFFTDKEQCLFDSIALMEFLMMHSIRADLVIGVTSDPFSAHAWVQAEQYVLNGSADYARRFQPIMTV
jgi:Transglutaminase-like superfamily